MNKLKASFSGIMNFKPAKIYWWIVIILAFTPVLYFSYLFISVKDFSANWLKTLQANPEVSIMFIISLVDLMLSYYLWQFHENIVDNKPALKNIYLVLLFFQTILGNIFMIFLSGMGLYKLKSMTRISVQKPQGLSLTLILVSIIYAFCGFMMWRIYF
ncbi:hypothetical protein [Xylocopilactobacillus apicola]|uniref:DUF4234 domain-containing protein n=1 Tax=Xylocopilactobacillus apicola TaxID=2932184 RepID=A0AAU9DVL7_9LACO|nr:hypothetical protein [Xylocopilactobacillus apicola]BDR57903.1 hypothetical protein XA3_03440 [Xylocopilactobacillus apicola]